MLARTHAQSNSLGPWYSSFEFDFLSEPVTGLFFEQSCILLSLGPFQPRATRTRRQVQSIQLQMQDINDIYLICHLCNDRAQLKGRTQLLIHKHYSNIILESYKASPYGCLYTQSSMDKVGAPKTPRARRQS